MKSKQALLDEIKHLERRIEELERKAHDALPHCAPVTPYQPTGTPLLPWQPTWPLPPQPPGYYSHAAW